MGRMFWFLMVGNELPIPDMWFLVPAMENTQVALVVAGLHHIKVTIVISQATIIVHSPDVGRRVHEGGRVVHRDGNGSGLGWIE
jgi:hypothetical protein